MRIVYKRISERFSEEKKGWAKNLKYSALPAIQTEKELEFLEGDDGFMIRVQLPGRFRMYDETTLPQRGSDSFPDDHKAAGLYDLQQKPYRNTGTR